MANQKVSRVAVGTIIKWGVDRAVLEPCGKKNDGSWFCVTHKKVFLNQLQKDSHIGDDQTHVLAWICDEHGFEVP